MAVAGHAMAVDMLCVMWDYKPLPSYFGTSDFGETMGEWENK
jgi:hypothetical protein